MNAFTLYTGEKKSTIQHVTPDIAGARAIIKVSVHQHQWLAGGYDLVIGHF